MKTSRFRFGCVLGIFAVLTLAPSFASATAITGSVTSTVEGISKYSYTGGDSYLQAGGRSFNQTVGVTDVKLASLLWHDKGNDNDKIDMDWNVSIDITAPPATDPVFPTNTLSLILKNNKSDTIELDNLSPLSFSVTGWQINNFHYLKEGDGTLSGNMWTNVEDHDSTLWLVADFTPTAVPDPPAAPVPEPGTMMLLGAGFLGLAVYGKRRRNA